MEYLLILSSSENKQKYKRSAARVVFLKPHIPFSVMGSVLGICSLASCMPSLTGCCGAQVKWF